MRVHGQGIQGHAYVCAHTIVQEWRNKLPAQRAEQYWTESTLSQREEYDRLHRQLHEDRDLGKAQCVLTGIPRGRHRSAVEADGHGGVDDA